MDYLTIILTILVGILAYRYTYRRKLNKIEEHGILHVKPWPLFGNMGSTFLRRCHFTDILNKVYNLDENAKYVGFYDFSEPIIVIRSPELLKTIAVKDFEHFVDHRSFVNMDDEPLFGKMLFSLRGEKWRKMRTLLSPAFTGSKMKAMFKLMSNCGENFANYLSESGVEGTKNVIDTKDAFTRYTNDVIATCAFGISVDSMRDKTNDFYTFGRIASNFEGLVQTLKFILVQSFPRVAKFFKIKLMSGKIERFFEEIIRETIETRDRDGITRPDMIQLMMETRGNKDNELTILEMTAQAFIFFLGGFETTSSLMCFVAYEIAVNPLVQEKLRNEIDEVTRETGGSVTYEAIKEMRYLDAVINETLRLFPIQPFLDRICVKSYNFPAALPGGKAMTVEPGQVVFFPVYSIHRDPKYFHEPDTFLPERFLANEKTNIDPSTYFPFGQGPRMCIANRFALLETKVMLFHLLAKCRLKPSEKTIVPLELNKASFTMTAKGGFWLEIESRDSGTSTTI